MSVADFLQRQNITVNLTSADLKEFAFAVLDEYKTRNEVKEDEHLNVQEVAEFFKKSVPTVWRWKKEGVLPPDGYIGKQPFWLLSRLKNFGISGK